MSDDRVSVRGEKIVKKLNVIGDEFINFRFVDIIEALNDGINFRNKDMEIVVIFGAEFSLDKLPKALNQVKIRAVGGYIDEVETK